MSDRRILVIGYGAIAADLVADLGADGATVCGVFLRPGSASREKVPGGITVCETIEEIAAFGPDLVVEAAGHEAVREIVPECLARGLPVLIASIGALHDEPLKARLVAKAREGGGRLVLASGALGGLDYVRAVRPAAELDLAYESRKPPAAWRENFKLSATTRKRSRNRSRCSRAPPGRPPPATRRTSTSPRRWRWPAAASRQRAYR